MKKVFAEMFHWRSFGFLSSNLGLSEADGSSDVVPRKRWSNAVFSKHEVTRWKSFQKH